MIYYLLFIAGMIIFSLMGISINLILLIIFFSYTLMIDFDLSSFIFILSQKLTETIFMPEVVAIPFFIISSELLINTKILKRYKETIFNISGNNILSFLIFIVPTMTASSTSMLIVKLFGKIFSTKEFSSKESYIKTLFVISSANYIAPVSVPIILLASLLKISLKTVTIYSLILIVPFLIINYFTQVNKNFTPKRSKNNLFSVIAVIGYSVVFYSLMFWVSLPVDIISIIMFFYSIICGIFANRRYALQKFRISILHSISRIGIITGVVYFIFLITFFHIYTFANNQIINFFTLSFTEGYYILIMLYILAFFMIDLIDPLGIILILFPIYSPILTTFNINKYYFALSFSFFVSSGLFNNIAELAGKKITEKFGINFSELSSIISPIYFIICIIAFGIYFL